MSQTKRLYLAFDVKERIALVFADCRITTNDLCNECMCYISCANIYVWRKKLCMAWILDVYYNCSLLYFCCTSLYICVDFDGDSTADNIRFVIKRLKIWTDPTDADYPFSGNMDVRTFLEVSDNCQDLYLGFCTY